MMPGRNRNPGAGNPHHGGPAKGAGHGGEAKGQGYGGPARGASVSRITADAKGDAIRALSRDPAHMAHRAEMAGEMLALLVDVARNGDADAVRVAAADKAMDRLIGKPVATQVITGADGGPMRIERVIVDPANPDAASFRAIAAAEPV